MADKLGSAGLAMRFVLIRFDMADVISLVRLRCDMVSFGMFGHVKLRYGR